MLRKNLPGFRRVNKSCTQITQSKKEEARQDFRERIIENQSKSLQKLVAETGVTGRYRGHGSIRTGTGRARRFWNPREQYWKFSGSPSG